MEIMIRSSANSSQQLHDDIDSVLRWEIDRKTFMKFFWLELYKYIDENERERGAWSDSVNGLRLGTCCAICSGRGFQIMEGG